MPRWTSLPFLYSLSNLALIAAQSFNITVDDQFGPLTGDKLVRIEYSSSDDWVSGGYGVNGLRKGSPSAAGFEDTIRGTWKRSIYKPGDKSGPPTANLTFKGTAVFVQCIITNVALNNQANSDMVFKIDDGLPTTYTRAALASKPGLITTVFHQDGLSPGEHTIFIQNGRERGGPPEFNSTAIFLDAIIFTTDNRTLGIEVSDASNMPTEPPLPSRAKSNTALIAAIVCSITAVVIIAVALWLFLRNRQQRKNRAERPISIYAPSTSYAPTSRQGEPSEWTSVTSPSSGQSFVSRDGLMTYSQSDDATSQWMGSQTTHMHRTVPSRDFSVTSFTAPTVSQFQPRAEKTRVVNGPVSLLPPPYCT